MDLPPRSIACVFLWKQHSEDLVTALMDQREMIPPLVCSFGNQAAVDQQRSAVQKVILRVAWIIVNGNANLTTGGKAQDSAIGGEHMVLD